MNDFYSTSSKQRQFDLSAPLNSVDFNNFKINGRLFRSEIVCNQTVNKVCDKIVKTPVSCMFNLATIL